MKTSGFYKVDTFRIFLLEKDIFLFSESSASFSVTVGMGAFADWSG